MSKNNYTPISTSTTKKMFFTYIDTLDIPQIDYFAIGLQHNNSKKSISLMSLPEWQKHFTQNNYADYDPIRKAALYTQRNFIPFNEVDFVDSFGKEIMHQRAKMGIKNGIILMQRSRHFNYMITLGTGFTNFNSFDFIKRYYDKLSLIKNDLILLITKESYLFLPKINQDY